MKKTNSTEITNVCEQLSVTVRMYCHGLGDCFLLTFRKAHKVYRILIDCGILQRTKDEKKRMEFVAKDILEQLDPESKTLDLVVATHEHHDHICGFAHASKIFDEITFKEIWVAWTEDPNNELAQTLREGKMKSLVKIGEAINLMNEFNLDAAKRVEALMNNFSGDSILAAKNNRRAAGLEYLLETKALSNPKPKYTYCYPGKTPISVEDFEEDVRVYVLGPPHDKSKLRDLSAPDVEKYRHHFAELLINDGFSLEEHFFFALDQNIEGLPAGSPFDPDIEISRKDAEKESFFEKNYFNKGNNWRNIEGDWLSMTSELALKMDSYTNNTSLVLAIELIKSKKVLLFVADAQFGNWKTWHDYAWTINERDGTVRNVKTADLLANTVLYKVGHHGSHNATLKASGLDLMTHPELVALIPVDKNRARKEEWEMPFGALLEDLLLKTNGRVVVADEQPNINPADKDWCNITYDKENKLFNDNPEMAAKLFIDYKITG